ncbi:hypothetical protein HBA92_21355 [Ochrobactrum sp. MR28]|nr:hypothetical protein [Ochrobactrum sp. MR28]MBX8818844.1 hypothetical protein [Ochrobactrum sp. MR31]
MARDKVRCCPSCLQPLPDRHGIRVFENGAAFIIDKVRYNFPVVKGALLHALYNKYPSAMSHDALLDVIAHVKRYPLDEPTRSVLSVHFSLMNQTLRGSRMKIKHVWGFGYELEIQPISAGEANTNSNKRKRG